MNSSESATLKVELLVSWGTKHATKIPATDLAATEARLLTEDELTTEEVSE